jgi:hypothetical protein
MFYLLSFSFSAYAVLKNIDVQTFKKRLSKKIVVNGYFLFKHICYIDI